LAVLIGLLACSCLAQNDGNSQGQGQSQETQSPQAQGADQSPQNETQSNQPANNSAVQPQVEPSRQQAPAAQPPAPNQPAQSSSSRTEAPPRKAVENPLVPNQTPITLDTSETIFSVLAALNACGYDEDLAVSDPTRRKIRDEVQRNLKESEEAQNALEAVCEFYQSHLQGKSVTRTLSQYISLALYIEGPPHFLPRVKEEEMPPDAGDVAGFGTALERFYDKARLHAIWERHRNDYAGLIERYHQPLAKMVFDTDIYLKLASQQYLGRTFTVYLDFLGSPNETNARNYGSDYDVVVFPSPSGQSALKMDQIRHTYLHYLLDPLADKHYEAIKRLEPLLQSVQAAPMENSFKTDISLLVTECLIRAIEIRTTGSKHTAEALRVQAVDDAVKQGYILTSYFYETIVAFENDPAGLRTAYGDFLGNIDLKKEQKAASEVQFAKASSPELLQLSRPQERLMLVMAERRLTAGDPEGAQELAQQALDKKIGDEGRALFILAEAAVAQRNMDGARTNFEKTIETAKDPKLLGWSHVYLGRILDLKDNRQEALKEYQAALNISGQLPEIKAAAERGLAQAYEPPARPKEDK
jgi:tetratricopeptide (TPR) repeat protein